MVTARQKLIFSNRNSFTCVKTWLSGLKFLDFHWNSAYIPRGMYPGKKTCAPSIRSSFKTVLSKSLSFAFSYHVISFTPRKSRDVPRKKKFTSLVPFSTYVVNMRPIKSTALSANCIIRQVLVMHSIDFALFGRFFCVVQRLLTGESSMLPCNAELPWQTACNSSDCVQ